MRIVIINSNLLSWKIIMYVCICKAVTDKQIKLAIEQGACTRRQVCQSTGAGNVCGKCSCQIKQMLDKIQQLHPIMQAA
jgi:bacterioferritin-associated ferredoxin